MHSVFSHLLRRLSHAACAALLFLLCFFFLLLWLPLCCCGRSRRRCCCSSCCAAKMWTDKNDWTHCPFAQTHNIHTYTSWLSILYLCAYINVTHTHMLNKVCIVHRNVHVQARTIIVCLTNFLLLLLLLAPLLRQLTSQCFLAQNNFRCVFLVLSLLFSLIVRNLMHLIFAFSH